jgi:hypothetical protein
MMDIADLGCAAAGLPPAVAMFASAPQGENNHSRDSQAPDLSRGVTQQKLARFANFAAHEAL